ncbi:MAG: hypothetical protein ACJAZO_004653 [Myxococcota bacterium]
MPTDKGTKAKESRLRRAKTGVKERLKRERPLVRLGQETRVPNKAAPTGTPKVPLPKARHQQPLHRHR